MNAFAGFANHPTEDIQIVTRLRQDDWCGLLAVMPVTPYIRMTHMRYAR
jgi:hypothetical protein